MKPVYIYTLRCPDTERVMYVGQSVNPEERLKQHMYDCAWHRGGEKSLWIRGLLDSGKAPLLRIIETSDSVHSSAREEYWINFFKAKNPKLTNRKVGRLPHATYKADYVPNRQKQEVKNTGGLPAFVPTRVHIDFPNILNKLQALKNRRYNATHITEVINTMHDDNVITRQTVARLLSKKDIVAVSDNTLGYLLDFFEQEGMPITLGQLFTVEYSSIATPVNSPTT